MEMSTVRLDMMDFSMQIWGALFDFCFGCKNYAQTPSGAFFPRLLSAKHHARAINKLSNLKRTMRRQTF